MRALILRAAAALTLPVLLASCDPAGTDLGFGAEETAVVAVGVYLDRDGTQSLTPADTVMPGLRVTLHSRGGGAPVAAVTTDLQGVAVFAAVPFGDYRVSVDPATVGDSLVVARVDPDTLRARATAPEVGAVVRLAFEEFSIRQARNAPVGTRVFIRGTVSAGVQSFSDLSSHLADTSRAIRLLGVTLLGNLTGQNPGDSVVVRGTVGQVLGQPVLLNAQVLRVATRPAPIPASITSGVAAVAANGNLDAAFVNLTSVTISDTTTVAPDFHVTASDGSGAVTIVLDANIPFNRAAFAPNRVMNIRGVLVPDGLGRWVLKPRGGGDVTFLN